MFLAPWYRQRGRERESERRERDYATQERGRAESREGGEGTEQREGAESREGERPQFLTQTTGKPSISRKMRPPRIELGSKRWQRSIMTIRPRALADYDGIQNGLIPSNLSRPVETFGNLSEPLNTFENLSSLFGRRSGER